MADKQYAILVSHAVTQRYTVTASSSVDANTKVGMVMALTQAGAEIPTELSEAIVVGPEKRTIKHVSQARTLIDDPDDAPTTGAPDET